MSDFDHLPAYEAGCKMPAHNTIMAADTYARAYAAQGSDRLLVALLRYGAKHGGIPNIGADECRAKLAAL